MHEELHVLRSEQKSDTLGDLPSTRRPVINRTTPESSTGFGNFAPAKRRYGDNVCRATSTDSTRTGATGTTSTTSRTTSTTSTTSTDIGTTVARLG